MIVLMALSAPLYLAWSWGDEIGQLGNDGADYMMMAHHYAHDSLDDAVYSNTAALSRFPPLYPLLLVWTHSYTDLHWAHLTTTIFLLLALVAFYLWQLGEGIPEIQAAALVLLVAFTPESWLAALSVQSEYLYLLLSFLALSLMTRFQRHGQINALYGAAIMVALAALTRTAGVALYAPLLLALYRAPRKVSLLAAGAAILPMVLWHLLHQAQLGYGSALAAAYSSGFLHGLYRQLTTELPALRQGFANNFLIGDQFRFIADALGLVCLLSVAHRVSRLEADGIYVAAYLLLLLIWPFPEEASRFLWVVIPIGLGQVLLLPGFKSHGAKASQSFGITACLLMAITLVMTAPTLCHIASRYIAADKSSTPGAWGFVSWYGSDSRKAEESVSIQVTLIDALRRIPEIVPQDGCVLSVRPEWIRYYSHRKSSFPPLNSTPEPFFHIGIHDSGCDFIFAISSITSRYPLPMFPMDRIGDEVDVASYSLLPSDSSDRVRLLSLLAKFK